MNLAVVAVQAHKSHLGQSLEKFGIAAAQRVFDELARNLEWFGRLAVSPGSGDRMLQSEDFGEVLAGLPAGDEIGDVRRSKAALEQRVDDLEPLQMAVVVNESAAVLLR